MAKRKKKRDPWKEFKEECQPGSYYGSRDLATVFEIMNPASNNMFMTEAPIYWCIDLATDTRVRRSSWYLNVKLISEMEVLAWMSRHEGKRRIAPGMWCYCGSTKRVDECCGQD